MNMSLMLHVLLWLFPHSFAQRFGDQWMSTVEDGLADARSRGRTAWAKAWGRLLADTAIQVPKAHAMACWAAVVGTVPSTAGMGLSGKALVMAKHWGWRPVMATTGVIYRHWIFLLAGAWTMVVSYTYWSAREGLAFNPNESFVLQSATPMEALGAVCSSLAMWALAGWALVMLTGPNNAWRTWRRNGSRLFPAALFFLGGLHMASNTYLLKDLGRLAVESVDVFNDYPALRDTPVRAPSDPEMAQWTPEERRWFYLNDQGHALVRPELQTQWCSLRQGVLDRERRSILAGADSAANLRTLLWRGLALQEVVQGCFTEAQILEQNLELWSHQQNNRSPIQRVWEHYSWLLPVADAITSAHYIVEPQVMPSLRSYCVTTAYGLLEAPALAGREMHAKEMVEQCDTLHRQFHGQDYSKEFRWMPGSTHRLRKDQDRLKPFLASDLPWLRQQLIERQSAWTTPKTVVGGEH